METLLTYLIRSVAISGLLLLYYQAALRNRKLHSFNRVYLLMTLLAAVVLPLIRLPWLSWHAANRPLEGWMRTAVSQPAKATGIPPESMVLLFSGCVSIGLLGILIRRIVAVFRLRQRHPRFPVEGCYLIEVQDRRAPFSFLNNLFWQRGVDIHDPVHRKIFDHELAHIRGRHTYDNLLTQAVAALFWMNPFFWVIRREMMMVHEFIADDASVTAGDTESFARMLLQAYDDGRYLDPSHRFFHSPIKRRLIMISTLKRPSGFRKWLALPALLAVMVLSCSKEQAARAPVSPPPPPPQQVQAKKFFKWKQLVKDSIRIQMDGKLKNVFFLTSKAGTDTLTMTLDNQDRRRSSDQPLQLNFKPNTDQEAGDPH